MPDNREVEEIEATRSLLRWWAIGAAAVGIAVLAWSLTLPIVEQHGFRQTQTAISVYWMLHGAPWIDYETPVMGAGWALPFEFPLYQIIVAGLARLTGAGIEPIGRILSFAWLVATIPFVDLLVRSYRLPRTTTYLYAILLMLSPVYLFWGHSFLIETQAVAAGFASLAFFRKFLDRPTFLFAMLAMIASACLDLTKITTAAPFLLAAGLMTLEALWISRSATRSAVTILVGAVAIWLPGLIAFSLWNHHADALKLLNPGGAFLRSSSPNMVAWNFGDLSQRFDRHIVKAIVRGLLDSLGWFAFFVAIAVVFALSRLARARRKAAALAGVLISCWLAPFLVFTNLHFQHNYYQAGNAALLLLGVAVVGAQILTDRSVLAIALLVVAISQIGRFATTFARTMIHFQDNGERALGQRIAALTPAGSGFVGLGIDWSAIAPYYAERRALLIPGFVPRPVRLRLLAQPAAYMPGAPPAAIVLCREPFADDRQVQVLLATLVKDMRVERIGDCRIHYRKAAPPPSPQPSRVANSAASASHPA